MPEAPTDRCPLCGAAVGLPGNEGLAAHFPDCAATRGPGAALPRRDD